MWPMANATYGRQKLSVMFFYFQLNLKDYGKEWK